MNQQFIETYTGIISILHIPVIFYYDEKCMAVLSIVIILFGCSAILIFCIDVCVTYFKMMMYYRKNYN